MSVHTFVKYTILMHEATCFVINKNLAILKMSKPKLQGVSSHRWSNIYFVNFPAELGAVMINTNKHVGQA